ncbi:HAD family hydrolase [Treponema primitia]|uniref:HAD family hydrolase n=1 Tax=Treponema primitia TaxID=88058 RepID=UPI0039805379
MREDIRGVAFDLDGTFYPNYRFYIRLIPFILKEWRYLLAFGNARTTLRKTFRDGNFYDLQAHFMSEILKKDGTVIKDRTEKIIYRGWEPLFKKVKPYPHVRETLGALKAAGLTLGLLSDFPAELKLEYLGLHEHWDTVICSEHTNRLKPDPAPFLELSRRMALPPEQILYVGNSVSYDIVGSKQVGMKAALISSPLRTHRRNTGNADFVFSDYRQLREFVLG